MIQYLKEFGLEIFIWENICKIIRRIPGNGRIFFPVIRYKDNMICRKLEKEFTEIIDKYKEEYQSNNTAENDCIWTFWWQGEDKMPEIVRICIDSMKKNHKNVRIITKENYKNFVTMPCFVEEKREKGQISLTHFSDLLRMRILKEYGGCWLDATIFVSKAIPDSIFKLEYYTGKLPERFSKFSISNYRWNGAVLAGKKENIFFAFANECFAEYWSRHNVLIDYFLIDYVTEIALSHIRIFSDMYNIVPYNNPEIFSLEKKVNEAYHPMVFKQLCADTYFFKFDWRKRYAEMQKDGGQTYFGFLKRGTVRKRKVPD